MQRVEGMVWDLWHWTLSKIPQPVIEFAQLVFDRWTAHASLRPIEVLIAVLPALFLALTPGVWSVTRQAATTIHEMGHVVAAHLVGRRVSGIKLHSDTSGVMISYGKVRGLGMLVTAMSGYTAPSAFAVVLMSLEWLGYSGAALTLYQITLVAAAFLAINIWGLLSALAILASTGFIWWYGGADLIAFVVVTLGLFYAVAGLRCTFDVVAVHRRHRGDADMTTDASQAAKATRLAPFPVGFWLGIFVIWSVVALLFVIVRFIVMMV